MEATRAEIIEILRNREQSLENQIAILAYTALIGAPLTLIGAIAGNRTLTVASLCWLVSHFIGYIARSIQEDRKEVLAKIKLLEAAQESEQAVCTLRTHVGMN